MDAVVASGVPVVFSIRVVEDCDRVLSGVTIRLGCGGLCFRCHRTSHF